MILSEFLLQSLFYSRYQLVLMRMKYTHRLNHKLKSSAIIENKKMRLRFFFHLILYQNISSLLNCRPYVHLSIQHDVKTQQIHLSFLIDTLFFYNPSHYTTKTYTVSTKKSFILHINTKKRWTVCRPSFQYLLFSFLLIS